jgi:hypothetical protein
MEQNQEPKKRVYLIEDGNVCKIGVSKNPYKRLKSIKTSRPYAILVAHSRNFTESQLHKKYKQYNIGGEWFRFPKGVYKNVIWDIANNKQRRQIMSSRKKEKNKKKRPKYQDWIIPFGRYKGTKLIDMVSEDQLGYIKWGKDNLTPKSYAKKAFKWWYDYYTGNGKVDYKWNKQEVYKR